MNAIFKTLWKQVYAHLRSLGSGHHDAEDFTQDVFAILANRDMLTSIPRSPAEQTALRSYLFTTARRVAIDHHRKATAAKRGGDHSSLELDAYDEVPGVAIDENSPANQVVRRETLDAWESQVTRLGKEAAVRGKGVLFQASRPFLIAGTRSEGLTNVAKSLKMKVATVRVQVHRWRQCLRHRMSAEFSAQS